MTKQLFRKHGLEYAKYCLAIYNYYWYRLQVNEEESKIWNGKRVEYRIGLNEIRRWPIYTHEYEASLYGDDVCSWIKKYDSEQSMLNDFELLISSYCTPEFALQLGFRHD